MTRQLAVPDVEVSVRGAIPADSARYAREKVANVLRLAPQQVLHTRVRLVESRAIQPPVLAAAQLDVNGRPVRAEVGGSTANEAVDLLCARLWRQLTAMARHKDARRAGRAVLEPTERRPGERPVRQPDGSVLPPSERQIVRRKSFSVPSCTVDEASFEMNLMDYDFHLFTEADSGQDSVLYRGDGAGYRLAQVDPHPEMVGSTLLSLTVDEKPAARLSVEQAVQRLELCRQPFVFFVEDNLGRGCVLYHRYDGHYGLITPVGATA